MYYRTLREIISFATAADVSPVRYREAMRLSILGFHILIHVTMYSDVHLSDSNILIFLLSVTMLAAQSITIYSTIVLCLVDVAELFIFAAKNKLYALYSYYWTKK